jgi:hypothetical protein
MEKEKHVFIESLLKNKKLSPVQHEKILVLTLAEIKSERIFKYNMIEERIERLEELNSIKKNTKEEDRNSNTKEEDRNSNNKSLPKTYFYPKSLHNFLLNYNLDPILRSTCHLIDGNELINIKEYIKKNYYDFNLHYEKIIEAYNKLEKKYWAPYQIKVLIKGYLEGKNFEGNLISGWSSDKITYNWNHNILREWSQNNPGIPPNPDIGLAEQLENVGFKFEKAANIKKYRPVQSFSDLVLHFKRMFHIREDNSLLEIIKFHNEKWNNQIDFQIDETYFQKNIEIFTDVDKVLQAYDDIIRLIILFNENPKPRVRLRLKESQVATSLSIHHLDRTYAKSLEACKNRLIGLNYSYIIKNLNGICNIYLTADFGSNQFATFAIWDEKWNIQKERDVIEALDTFIGVEHILEFKRK